MVFKIVKRRIFIEELLLCLCLLGCAKEREEKVVSEVIEPAHHWGKDCTKCHSHWNLIAMHDASSSEYNSDCIKCHGNMMGESSLRSDIRGIHPRMMRYVREDSITNETCRHCHQSVDFMEVSAGNIRKQVAIEKCAECHSPHGPGKPLYIEK